MSVFAEFEQEVSDAVDEVMGDPVTIIPRRRGRLVSDTADPGRPQRTVVGVVDLNPEVLAPKERGQFDGFQPDVSGARVHVSFDVRVLGEETGWPRAGDHLKAISMPGQPVFQVSRVGATELSRVTFFCVPAQAVPEVGP